MDRRRLVLWHWRQLYPGQDSLQCGCNNKPAQGCEPHNDHMVFWRQRRSIGHGVLQGSKDPPFTLIEFREGTSLFDPCLLLLNLASEHLEAAFWKKENTKNIHPLLPLDSGGKAKPLHFVHSQPGSNSLFV